MHAAGAVVWRRSEPGVVMAIVHRPRYDDWSLPKGKLDPGESFEEAALREVREETGVRGELGPELPATSYRDARGRSKLVRYWLLEARGGDFEPGDEVDELRWLAPRAARRVLTYERDAAVLDAASAVLASYDPRR